VANEIGNYDENNYGVAIHTSGQYFESFSSSGVGGGSVGGFQPIGDQYNAGGVSFGSSSTDAYGGSYSSESGGAFPPASGQYNGGGVSAGSSSADEYGGTYSTGSSDAFMPTSDQYGGDGGSNNGIAAGNGQSDEDLYYVPESNQFSGHNFIPDFHYNAIAGGSGGTADVSYAPIVPLPPSLPPPPEVASTVRPSSFIFPTEGVSSGKGFIYKFFLIYKQKTLLHSKLIVHNPKLVIYLIFKNGNL
jgi:hypothetical protein